MMKGICALHPWVNLCGAGEESIEFGVLFWRKKMVLKISEKLVNFGLKSFQEPCSGTYPSYFHVNEPLTKDHHSFMTTFAGFLEWS